MFRDHFDLETFTQEYREHPKSKLRSSDLRQLDPVRFIVKKAPNSELAQTILYNFSKNGPAYCQKPDA